MNTQPHAQHGAGGAPVLQYRSAFHGIATDRHGKFTNFVRRPDASHLQNGYWRFESPRDEQLAYFRGVRTPEDILCAVDRGDGMYEDISLLWIPGQIDPILKSTISGCAGQHLREIYDMRRFLGKPLSFRNQVPLYPMHPRMWEYWNNKRLPAAPQTQNAAQTIHGGPQSSHIYSAKGTSPVQAAGANQQLSPKGLSSHTTKLNAYGHIATNVVADATVLNQAPITRTTVRPPPATSQHPSSRESSLLPCQQPQSHQGQNVQYSQRSVPSPISPYTAQPQCTSFEATRSSNDGRPQVKVVANGRPHLPATVGQLPTTQDGQNQRLDRAFLAQSTQQAPQSPPNQGGRPGNLEQVTVANPQQLHNSVSFVAPEPSGAKHDVHLIHVSPASSEIDEVMQFRSPSPDSFHTVMDLDTDDIDTATTTPASNHEVPFAMTQESPTRTMTSKDSRSTVEVLKYAPQRPAVAQPVHPTNTSPKRKLESHDQELREDKRQKGNDIPHDIQQTNQTQPPLPPANEDMFPGLACMACGEEMGHNWDCFVGNLKPLKKPTMLDYRNLSDSVQRFDPGPWTTHQGPPPKLEQEDALDQLRGLADIIQNEDDYKSDTGLHALPEDFMIMAWAMKSSPGFELTYDFADDSGIGESEPE